MAVFLPFIGLFAIGFGSGLTKAGTAGLGPQVYNVFAFIGGMLILCGSSCVVTGLTLGLIGWIRGERPPTMAIAGTLVNACGVLVIVGCLALAAIGSSLQQPGRVTKDDRSIEVVGKLYRLTVRYPWKEVAPPDARKTGFDMLLAADDRTTFGIKLVPPGSKAEDLIKRFRGQRSETYRSNMQFGNRIWLRVECAGSLDGKESIEICYASDSSRIMMLGQCRPEERMEKTSMIDSLAATVQLTIEGGGP